LLIADIHANRSTIREQPNSDYLQAVSVQYPSAYRVRMTAFTLAIFMQTVPRSELNCQCKSPLR